MARPQNTVRGRARLARDSQQWMLDYLIQETGKVFHFQGEGRGRLPRRRAQPRYDQQARRVAGTPHRSVGTG